MSQKLPTGDGNNPLVLATFEGSIDEKPKPRILFYGYAVFPCCTLRPMNDICSVGITMLYQLRQTVGLHLHSR